MAVTPVDFTGVTIPFGISDMLTTATNFLALYGQWVLLALAVIFMPVLVGFLLKMVSAAKKRTGA